MPKETPQQYRERKERREKLLQSYKELNISKYKQNLETADSNTSGNDAGSSKEAKPPPNH